MRYCKKCTMPDTRPGITFDAEGVCSACRHYESRKNVDWDARFKEFEAYCDKYRGMNGPGGYDCAVAVSGGKDSHFQVWMLKEVMHMNPILFSVEDNFPMTQAGIHNLKNISEEFGCTIISCKPNIKVQKTLMRKFFEKYGKPTWYVDRRCTWPPSSTPRCSATARTSALSTAATPIRRPTPPWARSRTASPSVCRWRNCWATA